MTESTSKRLLVQSSQEGDVVIVAISGVLNHRIGTVEFEEAAALLRFRSGRTKLVIDLVDITALDSKGEGEIERSIVDVLANEGRAALVRDGERRYLYVGLEALVEALGDGAAVFSSRADAISFVRGAG